LRPSCHGDSRERKVRPGQGGTPPRRVQRRPRRSSQASRSRVRSAALADPIRNGTYGTRKVATANGKITTTPEGAGYHGVFAGALEGSRRWRGWQQEGAGRGAGDGGRRGDAKPQRARVPGRGNSGAPTLREAEMKQEKCAKRSIHRHDPLHAKKSSKRGGHLDPVVHLRKNKRISTVTS